MEDILPGVLVDQLCAVHLEGDENWEDILLQGHNQGGGRQQTAPGTVNKWLPSEIKWRLLRILADLLPVLDDLKDREELAGRGGRFFFPSCRKDSAHPQILGTGECPRPDVC